MEKINWTLATGTALFAATAGVLVGIGMLIGFGPLIEDNAKAPVFLLAAAVGAGGAGAVTSELFGRDGVLGATLMVVGSIAVTILGGILAGLFILPVEELGLVALALIMSAASPIALLWLALMLGVHFNARRLRATGLPT